MNPKKTKPVAAGATTGLRGSQQLGSRLNPSPNTTPPIETQAPDISGESDFAFFSRRPSVNTRTRLPFENEFPPGVLEPGRGAFVRVLIERDETGQPKRRARRRLRFCEGGTA
jgi:hypothetical protein